MNSLSPEFGAIVQPAAAPMQIFCLCAASLDDMGALLAAYSRGDFAGVIDLLSRGKAKAISLAEGVDLLVLSREDGKACIRIESGTHMANTAGFARDLLATQSPTE